MLGDLRSLTWMPGTQKVLPNFLLDKNKIRLVFPLYHEWQSVTSESWKPSCKPPPGKAARLPHSPGCWRHQDRSINYLGQGSPGKPALLLQAGPHRRCPWCLLVWIINSTFRLTPCLQAAQGTQGSSTHALHFSLFLWFITTSATKENGKEPAIWNYYYYPKEKTESKGRGTPPRTVCTWAQGWEASSPCIQ